MTIYALSRWIRAGKEKLGSPIGIGGKVGARRVANQRVYALIMARET
jgi:hypothetical protein